MRAWGGPVALRFAHELNAAHYPWSVGVDGNAPEDAIRAWRHVREVLARERADQVVWVWLVNVHAPGSAPYAPLYPGDEDVDSVAVDGYNGGAVLPWGGWRSPREVFGASVRDLRRLSDRPVVITEVGSAEQGGDKAAWIRELFGFAGDGGTRAVVWFDHAKEAGWRIASTPGAASAFRGAVAQDGREGPPPLPPRLRGGGQR